MSTGLTKEYQEKLANLIRETAAPIVAEIVEDQVSALVERKGSGGGTPAGPEAPEVPGVPEVIAAGQQVRVTGADEPRGMDVARMIGCFLRAKGDVDKALADAKKNHGANSKAAQGFEKALSASDSTAGGFIVQEEMATEIIELLRPASVIRRMGPRIAPLDSGTLRLPKITGGASGGYIGENQNITMSQQTFGQVVATARKLAVLTPVSNDLIRRSSANSEALVRDDLRDALALQSDLAFIRGTGVGGEPKGLKNWASVANTLASATSTPGSVTLANVTDDLGRMLERLATGNVAFRNVGWVFSPRTWRYLLTVRDGNGNLAFADELRGGTLMGFPWAMTSQIPQNLDYSGDADNDETEIYLADFADIVLAEATSMMIDASDVAAYHDGSTVVASFSQDQTVIRAIVEHDLVARHEESIVTLNNVVWGA